jgi:hypothetical protein
MEVSGQLHVSATLPSGGKAPGIHWIRGWVGPSVRLNTVEKRKIFPYRELNPAPPARKVIQAVTFLIFVLVEPGLNFG